MCVAVTQSLSAVSYRCYVIHMLLMMTMIVMMMNRFVQLMIVNNDDHHEACLTQVMEVGEHLFEFAEEQRLRIGWHVAKVV